MLRTLLGEMPRENSGLMEEAIETMYHSIHILRKELERNQDPSHDYRKLEIWLLGLVNSLDELEQSCYAAAFFRSQVKAGYMEDMSVQEQVEYTRYVYFYKNGFIRVFSILDKLGTVLNDMYDLNTSKVKSHYSYFTVLRQFRANKVHPQLEKELTDIKETYKNEMTALRKRRNTEIHYMNSEMQDDLWQRHQGLQKKLELEDLDLHMRQLEKGLEMVCRSLISCFKYTNKQWAEKGMHP